MSELNGALINITGTVQGVGFRPFVYGLALQLGIKGWVRNTSGGVDIQVDSSDDLLDIFIQGLKEGAPPLARIDTIRVDSCPPNGFSSFKIVHSETIPGAFISISPDVSMCADCYREMLDPGDRRYIYPFINCTNCGPRFTIIEDIPYDRPKTTMAPFEMCTDCRIEYEDPLDRRFHAQPVACPECGPQVWVELTGQDTVISHCGNAIITSQGLLSSGKILAIKGLGGFHLACDATNPEVVSKLRSRKLRVDKPFALMMPDIETVEQHCLVNSDERETLTSRERPIVLLQRRPGSMISPAVAPNQKSLGVMLPYTPLHYLIFAQIGQDEPGRLTALVMTSGNLREEPIAYTNAEARSRLYPLADAFLMHDRGIRTRCDDSVVRQSVKVFNQKPHSYFIRRSRGFTPNPIHLPWDVPQILAVGPELKNTFCLTKNKYAFMSHHIGDMENYETLQSFEDGIHHFEKLFRISPEAIACDLHPNYLATRYGLDRAQNTNLPVYQIQHHHAHIAACLADNGFDGTRPVIGVSFDGTGYGDDGTVWGGEFLIADYFSYQRFAHLEYTPLPGGDAATRKPFRLALAQLWHHGIPWDEDLPPVSAACGDDLSLLLSMLENKISTPLTSSIGRLFDSISALTGARSEINYEAQAAIEFEALADPDEHRRYHFDSQPGVLENNNGGLQPLTIGTQRLLEQVIADIHSGVSLGSISSKFHNGLAHKVAEVCQLAQSHYGIHEVALSGGVWQNMTLLAKTISLLEGAGFTVYIHQHVPANDGGLSLGQAVIAARTHQRKTVADKI